MVVFFPRVSKTMMPRMIAPATQTEISIPTPRTVPMAHPACSASEVEAAPRSALPDMPARIPTAIRALNAQKNNRKGQPTNFRWRLSILIVLGMAISCHGPVSVKPLIDATTGARMETPGWSVRSNPASKGSLSASYGRR